MSIFGRKSDKPKKGNRKLMVVVGILAVMVLGVSGCKSQTVETVIPSETVVVESTEDRFAVNDDLDVGYYDEASDSIKTGLSETLSATERKALTQDLDGELDTPLDAEVEEMSEADYAHYDGIIAQMKSEIDSDIFPQEFMDTLEADMAEFWLSGCTDEVYIAEKTVEITDYWNAKYNKPVTKDNTQQTKSAPKETQAPVKETPKETQAPKTTQNNGGNTQGTMTPEEKAILEAITSPEAYQERKDTDKGLGGSEGLSADALDVDMY